MGNFEICWDCTLECSRWTLRLRKFLWLAPWWKNWWPRTVGILSRSEDLLGWMNHGTCVIPGRSWATWQLGCCEALNNGTLWSGCHHFKWHVRYFKDQPTTLICHGLELPAYMRYWGSSQLLECPSFPFASARDKAAHARSACKLNSAKLTILWWSASSGLTIH